MELIARISTRRYDMGETMADNTLRVVPGSSSVVFRVSGKSLERAIKLLAHEIGERDEQTVVLVLAGNKQSEAQKSTFKAAYSKAKSLSAKTVVCGGKPEQIFDRLAVYRDSLRWFPDLHAYVSSLELNSRH